MNKGKCLLLVNILGMLSVSVPIVAAGSLDAREVLRRFTEARKNLNSFIVKAHEDCTYTYSGFNGIGVSHSNAEFRYDGNRVKNITYHWGDIGPRDRDVKEEDAHYYSNLWDGETAYSFTKSDTHGKGTGMLKMSDKSNPGKYSKIAPESFRKTHFGEVMGYHRGDDVRIGELFLRPSTKLQLRGERNNVNGVDCYVVEADVPEYGKYTVWIDPVHDFHIARIRVQRKSGDHVYKQMLDEKAIQKEFYEVLEFEKKGDAWFPKTCKMKKAYNGVEHQSSWEKEFSFSMITLNPDHDALGSFLPDDIPNGSYVRLLSLPPSKKFLWQDGKFVDKDGREVEYKSKKPSRR